MQYARLFQVEIAAIHCGTYGIIRQKVQGIPTAIFSIIKATNAIEVNSRLVSDWIKSILEVGSENKLTIA